MMTSSFATVALDFIQTTKKDTNKNHSGKGEVSDSVQYWDDTLREKVRKVQSTLEQAAESGSFEERAALLRNAKSLLRRAQFTKASYKNCTSRIEDEKTRLQFEDRLSRLVKDMLAAEEDLIAMENDNKENGGPTAEQTGRYRTHSMRKAEKSTQPPTEWANWLVDPLVHFAETYGCTCGGPGQDISPSNSTSDEYFEAENKQMQSQMSKNVASLQERGERLDKLNVKTAAMKSEAATYAGLAEQLKIQTKKKIFL